VVLLFYRIWGGLSTAVQVAVLAAAPLASLGLVETAHRIDRARHLVFVAAVIACAAFIMNVSVAGDIFAMRISPNALAAWAALAVAIGFAYGLGVPIAAGLFLAIGWAAGLLVERTGAVWSEFPDRPETLVLSAAIVVAVGVVSERGAAKGAPWICRLVGL